MTPDLTTAYSDAADSPGRTLWRVTNAWQRAVRVALTPHDLTHVQFVLLASLTWMDRSTPVTQRDLATYAGTDVMMTSQVIRALEAKGYLTRATHPTDRRAITVEPTTAGIDLVNRANADVEAADQAYFSALAKNEQATFLSYLHTLDDAGAS